MLGRTERHLQGLVSGDHDDRLLGILRTRKESSPVQEDQDVFLPPEFTWRDYTIFLLTVAAQIEHSLMVQYLYAAYSLGGPQTPQAQKETVSRWREVLLGLAKEEMGHLATVQNALRFMGAPLALDREDYPWDSLLAPFPFVLENLSLVSLAKYIVAESPVDWPDDVAADEREMIETLASSVDGQTVNRVGALYLTLIKIIGDSSRLPDSAFRPDTYQTQASWDEWGRGYGKGARGSSISGTNATPDVLIIRMGSRPEVLDALRAIADQGEAPGAASAANERSHFRRFLEVFREFPKDTSWEPTLQLPTNPVAPGAAVSASHTSITNIDGGLWANVFNLRYRMLLSYLAHTFHAPVSDDLNVPSRRGMIINHMFAEMYNLRAIAALLVRLPLSDESDISRCGPPFQMPYSLQLPDDGAAYWALHLDLLNASEALLVQAASGAQGPSADYAAALLSLDRAAQSRFELYASASELRTANTHPTGKVG